MDSIRTSPGWEKDSSLSPGGVLMESTYSIYTLVHLKSLHVDSMWTPQGGGLEWMRTGTGLYEEWKDYRWTPTGLLGYMWTPCGLPQDLWGSEKYTTA